MTTDQPGISEENFSELKFWLIGDKYIHLCGNLQKCGPHRNPKAAGGRKGREKEMKIVIAGAGEMGSHLARMLSGHGHD
ncbi:MAG: hypothetical protein K2I32_07430, partial [Alistipes sp.]|nr:hypothetical protein [Alistipes sp.]